MPRMKTVPVTAGIVAVIMLAVYLLLLSNNFNGDGLGYARIVEDADSDKLFSISARLLFCPTGRLVHTVAENIGFHLRAVRTLQIMNSVFGAIGIAVFFLTAFGITRDVRLSLLAAIGLGFSLAYWFWCTNATSYPGNIMFLVITLYLLIKLTRVDSPARYLALSLLIGMTHAVANFYWLSAMLLAPSIAVGVLLARREIALGFRLKAAIAYCLSFAVFLFVPLLTVGLATGRVQSLNEFPSWLTAASYGIPPKLSLLNLSRGIIGFSSSIFRITELGPAVKQAFWGVPYAIESTTRLYAEIAAFILLWLVLLAAAIYILSHRRTVFASAPRQALILALWVVPPTVFGLTWLGSDTERWLSVVIVFWLMTVLLVTLARLYLSTAKIRMVKIVLSVFVLLVFIQNLIFAAIPDHDLKNNRYMQTARFLSSTASQTDLILVWGHDNIFTADYLIYFFGVEALHLGQVAREQPRQALTIVTSRMQRTWSERGRVFVSGRVFLNEDLPESHRSDDEARISRKEFAEFFGRWKRTAAMTDGKDTYWEITEK